MRRSPALPFRSLLVAALSLALGAAAQDQPKPREPVAPKPVATKEVAKKPPKKEAPPKDDPVTAKDPVVLALDKLIAKRPPAKKQDGWRLRLTEPPKQTFAADRTYYWHLQTAHGEIKAKLRPDVAPMHVTNVLYLTRMGFYDDLDFHRVIKGFMAQGGCPVGNGTGNPGYQLDLEVDDKVKHDKPGILSTANEAKPKTDGSQFFITFAAAPHLDGKYTLFGEVVSGMEAVQALEARAGDNEKPTERLTIARAFVTVEVAPKPAK
jgi:peptidyl-prolyl cis-trans isomerase B (cyclophilin B)